jgi:hypothetical protein
MVHSDANHLADTAAVEDFNFVDLCVCEGPGIASQEEDIDGGGNAQATLDVEGDLAVSKEFFFASGIEVLLGGCLQ